MKKLKKGCDPLVNKDAFQQRNSGGKRTLICLPASLHSCIDEIRYCENTTLRSLISKAMATCVDRNETMHAPDAVLHLCSIKDDKTVRTSVTFSIEDFDTLRAVRHYWKVSYNAFVVDVLIRYLVMSYGDTHADAPGMDKLKSAINNE